MSRIVKAGKVILGENKYSLAPEISPPVEAPGEAYVIGQDMGAEVGDESAIETDQLELLKSEGRRMLNEAGEEAKIKLESATRDAEKIINKAYDDARIILEDSKEQGYREGFEIGMNESHAQMEEMIAETLVFKKEIMRNYCQILAEVKSDIVSLVIDITGKVLNKEMDDNEEYVEAIVNAAVEKCAQTTNLVLRVAPVDYGAALAIKDRVVAKFEKVEDIEIKQDSSLERGSCVLDTAAGSIDSSVDKQMNMVLELFNEMLGSE